MSTTRTRLFVVAFAVVTMLAVIPGTAWGQLTVTDDTYVSGAAPTTANGSVGSLVVQGSTTGKPGYTYIRFDLTSLGTLTGPQVQKATVRLYVSAVTVGGGFDGVEVTSPTGWVEGTLIYNTPNASTPAGTPLNINPIAVQYPSGKYQYILVDVTQAVRDWLNGTANNGLVLKPHDTSISVAFASKEDTTYSHDPVLVVQHDTSLAQIPGQIGPSQVSAGTYGINVSGTAATAGQFDHVTIQCAATNLFAVGITPAGHANCFQVMFSQLGGTATKLQLPTSAVFTDQANTFAGDKKQTFTAGANYAGLNIAGVATSPNMTNLASGDLWFDTTAGRLNFRKDNTATGTKSLAYSDDISGIQSAAQTYTDAQVAAEAAARQAADSTITTNLNNEVSRAQGAESTLQTNINTETTARQAADTAEATTRGMADATLSAAIGTETTRATGAETTLQSNITALDTASAKLASPNTFTANNTFTGAKVDLSQAGATLPVHTITGNPPTGTNICMPGQMVLQKDGATGQQLFICNATFDGWVAVNDDSALNSSLQSSLAAETTARQAADSTITTNLNNEVGRAQGAEATLQTNITTETAARQAADTAEATTRAMADATLSAVIGTETTRATGAETTLQSNVTALDAASAKLASPNTFTANNTFTGAKVDLSQAGATLPVHTITGNPPTGTNICMPGQMVLQKDGATGQQLFICNATFDGWVAVNDDSALNSSLQSSLAAETTARQAADSTITTNLNNEVGRAQGAEATLQTNITTETAARQAADTAEATTRAMADATLNAAIGTETTRATGAETTLQNNITALDAASAKLASPNTFTANNTFTGAKVDLSQAGATLPVHTITGNPPTGTNICMPGQMVLQK